MSRKKELRVRPVFTVILRRANGRYVKQAQRSSRYAAKLLAEAWDEKHPGMYTEIRNGAYLS